MVDGVSSISDAASRTGAGRVGLATNFETFLQLLTTQLRNQDPLSPLDSNEFTAQLTQMSGVEQQLLTNDLLTSLLAAQQGGGLGAAATYIGKEATAAWSATELTEGRAGWTYELASTAGSATLEVLDSSGTVVWSGPAPERGQGLHDFAWDGRASNGNQMPDGGVYSLRIKAQNANGGELGAQVLTRGRVTGVEMYDGQPFLTIGNAIVPLTSLIALDEMSATASRATSNDGSSVSNLLSAINPLKLFA